MSDLRELAFQGDGELQRRTKFIVNNDTCRIHDARVCSTLAMAPGRL